MTARNHVNRSRNVLKAILEQSYPIAVEDIPSSQLEGTRLKINRDSGNHDRRYALELKSNKANGEFNGYCIMNATTGFESQQPLEQVACSTGYFLLGTEGDLAALQDWARQQRKTQAKKC